MSRNSAPLALATAAVVGGTILLVRNVRRRANTKTSPQVVLVTGASSGIGLSSCLQLIQEGHIVYGAARRVDKMKEIQNAGGHAIELDVCNEQQIVKAVQTILQEQGRIDVLINNAGYGVYGALEQVPIEEARKQFEVNVFGLARLTQEIIPHMRQQQSGTIINVSSIGGQIYGCFGGWYYASKHALECYSDCLRVELKEFGVNVVIVEPGFIATEFADVMSPPLLELSRGGPYDRKATNFTHGFAKTVEKGSDPSVIANTMADIVKSKSPKRRYLVGKAKEVVYLRKWLGDAVLDFLIEADVNTPHEKK